MGFRKIKGFSKYRVNEKGEIKNIQTKTIFKGSKKQTGYMGTILENDEGKRKDVLIHRLVAEAFIAKPKGIKAEVNHKNGDKTDNRTCNLEWVEHNENLKHAYETGLRKQDVSNKAVIAIEINGKKCKRFSSIYKAARTLKISQGNICMCCKGMRKNAGGYIWSYDV